LHQTAYFNKRLVIPAHIAAWLLFFSLPLLLHSPFDRHIQLYGYVPSFDLFHTVTDLALVGIFYLNACVLLPRQLRKRKTGFFLVMLLVLFGAYVSLDMLLFRWLITPLQPPDPFGPPRSSFMLGLRQVFPYLLIIASSTAYRMILDRIKSEREAGERENENLKTELQLLRSQISPHFMFNVLNNMVSLARKHSDQLESSLMRLSSLMRYMYFEAQEDKVPLSKEVDYLQSYIDLQVQRFRENVVVRADLATGYAYAGHVIEPMLLIPFVENAFKHGTTLIDDAEIDIRLQVEQDVLSFFVSNKFGIEGGEARDRTTGIGLANVKRRLTLLYGDRHRLEIAVNGNIHTVLLQLNLN
jgi:hypothetical protein